MQLFTAYTLTSSASKSASPASQATDNLTSMSASSASQATTTNSANQSTNSHVPSALNSAVDLSSRTESYENGHWYLEDSLGNKLSGWRSLSGNRVAYYDPNTYQMVYGEKKINNKWYDFNIVNGDVITGWTKLVDGRQVYYDVQKGADSVSGQGMLHGMQEANGTYYYFSTWDGRLETGLKKVNGKSYYFAPSLTRGEQKINGYWYDFDSQTGVMKTGFVQLADGRTVYYNDQGQMQYGEQKINGKWYDFNTWDGRMAIGWATLADGRKVYYDVNANGTGQGMLHGISKIGDQTYDFSTWDGREKTGFDTSDNKIYYFDPQMVTDQAKINNHWYDFDSETGAMKTDFVQLADGRTVYYNQQGQMQYGEQKINGKWYDFNTWDGRMAIGWTTLADGRKVYYDVNADGTGQGMLHGRQIVNDHLYSFDDVTGALKGELKNTAYYNLQTKQLEYFGIDGTLNKNTEVKFGSQSYQASAEGNLKLIDGENYVDGNWYLYDVKSGQVKTGWQHLSNNRTVYYDPTTAVMAHGENKINGAWYYFNPSTGAMVTGFVTLSDGRYVYYQTNGQMQHGEIKLGGHWHYFSTWDGNMAKSQFIKLSDGRLVYYNSQGQMEYGWQNIDGKEYHFDQVTGDAARGDVWIGGKEYFFDSGTGAQITDSYTIKLISWFYHRVGKITYSMYGSRDGADGTADCSGSVTRAIYEASGVPCSYLYNTESLHGYLIQNGYHLVHENSGYENDHRLGDVIIWGRKGYSAGEFGHTTMYTGSSLSNSR